MQTDLYALKSQVEQAQDAGRDLLAEMAQHLDDQISEAQSRLKELKEKLGV
jgi:hypothetical protein